MRFLPDSPDIPDDLVRDAAAGEVVFLCGAGVSMRAGLPLFEGLTQAIYDTLGESAAEEAPERDAIHRKEYDRALRSLERRTHRPDSPRSRVRDVAAALLAAPAEDEFADHLALLQISRDSTGRPRVLTTNFDTLFEHAVAKAGLSHVPSHAGKSIPKPGSPRDYGIFHLHGRIGDEKLGLEETDFVLTSADFGDAYLRDGWTSRYIEDRMRLGTLVLIGYRAEDAAFRLLLETLDADRYRFPDLKNIYAIEKAETESASFWRAKGIKPIEFPSHDAIYSTLKEWAKFAMAPAAYARERLQVVLTKNPKDITNFEQEQVRFFLEMERIGQTLLEVNPSLTWMPVVAAWRASGVNQRILAAWIQRNFSEARAVRDVVTNLNLLEPEAANFLENHLRRRQDDLPIVLTQSWRLIIRHIRSASRGLSRSDWFELKPRLRRGEQSIEILERLTTLLRPRLLIGKRISPNGETATQPAQVSELMSIEYEVDNNLSEREVLEAWPESASSAADADLVNHLTNALEATLAVPSRLA